MATDGGTPAVGEPGPVASDPEDNADGEWHDGPGDTPLTDPPADYAPDGASVWFEIPDGNDAGKRLFVRDSLHGVADDGPENGDGPDDGDTEPAETIVLVHGNPECSYTYRHVVRNLDALADRPFRVVTMDHVGFGRSDRASYRLLCPDHAENLAHLVAAMDLTDVTLVIHDWGGPIGIGAFLRDPERVSNLVVTNSAVFPIPDDGLTFDTYPMPGLAWPRMPSVVPDRLWPETAAYVVMHGSTQPRPLGGLTSASRLLSSVATGPGRAPLLYGDLGWYVTRRQTGWLPDREPDAHRVYSEQFRDETNVQSSKLLVRQTPTWGEGNRVRDPEMGVRDTHPFYERIHDRIEAWAPDGQDIGVRAVVGEWDPTAKPASMARWVEALPQLDGHVTAFEDLGHFIEEERPAAVARAIRDVADL